MSQILAAEHMWNTGHIPMPLRGLRIADHIQIPQANREAAEEFVESFPDRWLPANCPVEQFPKDRSKIGVGMTLSGPAGRGKTTLACAIATDVALRYHAKVFFVAVPNYLAALYNRHAAHTAEAERAVMQTVYHRAQHAALLILDDMGAEFVASNGSAQKEFNRLLRSRHDLAQPTIITTNLGPTGWVEGYGAAAASFLHQAAPIVQVVGPDLRRGA